MDLMGPEYAKYAWCFIGELPLCQYGQLAQRCRHVHGVAGLRGALPASKKCSTEILVQY